MMRSLFLLAILVALVAFAFKEPDQSAVEFARDVGAEAKEALTPAKPKAPSPAPTRKVAAEDAFAKDLKKSLEAAKEAWEEATEPRPAQAPRGKPLPARLDAPDLGVLPARTDVDPSPPALPRMPVETRALAETGASEGGVAPSQTKTRPPSLAELTTYYEEASRLLEAIK